MRIRVLSDLHIEFAPFVPPPVEADVVVLAGDVHPGKQALAWIRQTFPGTPVVFVPGNHEFYGQAIPKLIEELKRLAVGTKVHVLSDAAVVIGGVRFLGATLWTDFNLFGTTTLSGRSAAAAMTDYKRIRVSPRFSKLKGLDSARFHAVSRRWLESELANPFDGSTVVVTHHAPSAFCLNPKVRSDELSPAYASALDDLVAGSGAALWIHGHTHFATDFRLGATRVVSNQRGYPDAPAPGFRDDLVIGIS
jgi:predicted phosphodiesterase